MTTFVAALHLPYTVQFRQKGSRPGSSSSLSAVAVAEARPLSLPLLQLQPALAHEIPKTPYDSAAAPVPNLLESLGHGPSVSSPTPPLLSPAVPGGGEELFFRIPDCGTALGSPSDPSRATRRAAPPPSAAAVRPSPTPFRPVGPGSSAAGGGGGRRSVDSGYFDIPVGSAAEAASDRPNQPDRPDQPDQPTRCRPPAGPEDWAVEKTDFGNGGLRNAVEASSDPSEKVYVGTLGFGTDDIDESTKAAIEGRLRKDHSCLVAYASNADFDGHYEHYCKEVLWPVFHYLIPDHPKSKAFLDHSWKYFEAVNRSIANAIIKAYKQGDTVWVNDYHLLLVPGMVRDALGPDARIGFFLHVGFPSSEIFRCLAHRERLLYGILGATMAGFQTEEYVRHFLQTCSRLLNVEVQDDGVLLDSRLVNVLNLPIGIDPAQLDEKRREPETAHWIKQLQQRYAGKKLFVARDKLDGVRGVKQKLLAYELFLRKNPQWVGKVVLIQVALTTTSIVESQSAVSDIVTRINCAYSTLDYQPVVYLHQDITYHQYIALLEVADALVVTSLRDGMNLTSHEFVYLQDRKHAPLILSEFTGSASIFGGAEIAVNPWDHSMCAIALARALAMPAKDKKRRWQKLHAAVVANTASRWFSGFLSRLDAAWDEQQRCGSTHLPRLSATVLAEQYRRARRRVFFLQYEGTLVAWGASASGVVTSPQRILDTVNDLLEDPANVVYIMSARTCRDLEQIFLRVPGVGIFAEGGCFLRRFGTDDGWLRLADGELAWKGSVREILDYYVERTPGTWLEERSCSFIWHLEKAEDAAVASRQAGDCCSHVNGSCESFAVHAIPIAGGVLVECSRWNKVNACSRVVEGARSRGWHADFVLVAGSGRDDEPVFEWANGFGRGQQAIAGSVVTVRVGTGHTQANATTTGVAGVVTALQKLATIAVAGSAC